MANLRCPDSTFIADIIDKYTDNIVTLIEFRCGELPEKSKSIAQTFIRDFIWNCYNDLRKGYKADKDTHKRRK